MSGKQTPVFVERRTYRRRRLADAARLMPVFGAVLFLVPMLWKGSPDEGGGASTAFVMFYLFLVWLALAAISGLLSHYLTDDTEEHGDEGGPGAPGGGPR